MLRGAIVVFTSGFSVMVLELVAGRLMAPHFGQSTRTWAALTGVTLAGVTLGNFLGGLLAKAAAERALRLRLTLVLSTAGMLTVAVPHLLPHFAAFGLVGFAVAGWLPLTLVLGCVTPIVAALFVRSEANGRDLGRLYLASMIGSALGSALGGLVLPFVLPADTLYLLMGGVLLALSAVACFARGGIAESADASDMDAACDGSRRTASQALMFLSVFVVGWFGMGVELAGARLVTPLLGGNHVVWALVFVTFIGAMGVGGEIGGRIADRFDRIETVIISLLALATVSLATTALLTSVLPQALETSGPVARLLSFTVLAFSPLAFVLGVTSTAVLKFATAAALERGDRSIVGFMYATSAAGCVCGTFVTGFYCVGRINSMPLSVTLALALVALAAVWSHDRAGSGGWRPLPVGACAAVAALALACWLGGAFRVQIPNEIRCDAGRVLLSVRESPYNVVTVSDLASRPGVRTVWLDRIPHTTVDIADRKALHTGYTRLIDSVVEDLVAGISEPSLFMIGGGGYALPRKWTMGNVAWRRLVVAEIDDAVLSAARQYLDADPVVTNGVWYAVDDGRRVADQMLRAGAGGTFDIAVGDTISDSAIPYHLVTKEFNDRIKGLLKPTGVYLLHVLDQFDSPSLIASLLATLRASYRHVGAFSYQGVTDVRQSFVIVASDEPARVDMSAYARNLERRYPESCPIVVEGAAVGRLVAAPDACVLTDRFAPVERFVWRVVAKASDKRSEREAARAMSLLKAEPCDPDEAKERAKRALALIEQALARDPELPEAIAALRRYLEDYPDDVAAFELMKAQAARKSAGFVAQAAYASVLAQRGDFESAERELHTLCRRFPMQLDFARGWLINAAHTSRREEAKAWLEKNLARFPPLEREDLKGLFSPKGARP